MGFTLVAVVVGLALGVALGGHPRNLAGRSFRWWVLLPVGLVLQAVLGRAGVPAPFSLLVASYACLLVFAAANLRLTGMWLLAVGFAMNAVAITLNHGMPVRPAALRSIGAPAEIDSVKHHVERPSDRLTIVGDVIPVPPLAQVLSFGDLVLSVGVVDLLVHLMRAPRRPVGAPRERTTAA